MTRRLSLFSLLLLFASAAFAQTGADLTAVITAGPTVDATRGFTWSIDVINNGPESAQKVAVEGFTDPALDTGCFPSSVDTIFPNSHAVFQCGTKPLGHEGDIVLHAQATSLTTDPHTANNNAARTVHAIAGPDLALLVGTPTIDPGLPFGIALYYSNFFSEFPASNVTATVTLPPQIHVVKLPDGCTQAGQVVTCAAGTLPAGLTGATPAVTITAVADDSTNGQIVHIIGDIRTTDPEGNLDNNHYDDAANVFRTFFVTDTTSGALGAAIDQANLNCSDEYPCKVAFRLGTPPESGYFTLKPVIALPKITGKNISIDGTTQTRLTGDTNPNGPEVFIDGSDSTWEDALAVDQPCELEIAGLAIGNFKNAAVTVSGELAAGRLPCNSVAFLPRTVHDNYLGVDPTGTQPAPNGRGVVINDRLFAAVATKVTNNVISANRRSGIWIGRAAGESISGNRIGLDIHNEPLGNGASGIYAGPNVFDLDIRGNYVAFNHDFGIAIDRNAIGIDIGPNSIFANAQLGIDVGLDGPTPDRDIPAPVVLSAQYDPATNTTVLTISSHEPPNVILPTVTMYASDAPHRSGYGDGQYYLGSLRFNSTDGNIRFAATGDWRGKWVAATVTRNNFFGFLRANVVQPNAEYPDTHSSTSEFSRAVEVE